MTVTIPDLSHDFINCFQWDTMELIYRTYKACMQNVMSDCQEHTWDFFYRRIYGPLWDSATIALYLKGIWHDHGLDDNRHNLSHAISVLNFLDDPPALNNVEYLDYLKKSHLEDLEALVEEKCEKRQKMVSKFSWEANRIPLKILLLALRIWMLILHLLWILMKNLRRRSLLWSDIFGRLLTYCLLRNL